jgi:hypothetical protein
MKNQGESHPLLASILSAPNGATSSDIKNETFRNDKQSTATYGHPALDPIWIQENHLQLTNTEWSKMTFNPAYGLEKILPNSSDSKTNSNQQWPLLDDAKYFNSLQDSIITNVDLAKFGKITQELLSEITPVPVTNTGQTGKLSRHHPITEPPIVVHQTNVNHAKILQPPGQGQKDQVDQQSVTSLLHPRILKAAEIRTAQRMNQKKVKPPGSKQVLPNKKGGRKPTKAVINALKPGFNNQDLRKIFGLMKKLDTDNPNITTPPEVALMAAQQRQQWLQALNIGVANLNRKEAGIIFALYHRFPFPKYHQDLMTSQNTKNTTNSSCESKNF